MKKIRLMFIFLAFAPVGVNAQYACSGLNRVDIYRNNKLIATATPADAPTIRLDTLAKTDTITLHAFTDWEGLRNSTVDINNESGELMDHINSSRNTGYEAVFVYIFIPANLDNPHLKSFTIFLNLLCERSVETERIATVKPGGR